MVHVQNCYFANLNLLLFFAVLVAVAVVFAYLSSLLGGEGYCMKQSQDFESSWVGISDYI